MYSKVLFFLLFCFFIISGCNQLSNKNNDIDQFCDYKNNGLSNCYSKKVKLIGTLGEPRTQMPVFGQNKLLNLEGDNLIQIHLINEDYKTISCPDMVEAIGILSDIQAENCSKNEPKCWGGGGYILNVEKWLCR